MASMKSALFYGSRNLRLEEVPVPEVGRGEVLVRIERALTCATDLKTYIRGRHKMIPRISPGKAWEGFGGALLFSAGGSVVFARLAGTHLTGMNTGHALLLGGLLGAAAVLGDLIESLFKREAGAKDSGRLFPGIGGILDLLDSLLFNAPLMYLYLRHVLTS